MHSINFSSNINISFTTLYDKGQIACDLHRPPMCYMKWHFILCQTTPTPNAHPHIPNEKSDKKFHLNVSRYEGSCLTTNEDFN